MVKIPAESARTREELRRLSRRSLFLHFINRELLSLRGIPFSQSALVSAIKTTCLMTSGQVVAPFAQASELFWNHKRLIELTVILSGNAKLEIVNQNLSFDAFIDSRRAMYRDVASKYGMYISKRPLYRPHYKIEPHLNTTEFIKGHIVSAIDTGIPPSNQLSTDEIRRLAINSDYIKKNFRDTDSAATFSVYKHSIIEPKPDEVNFFGHISTRLFSYHYSSQLDAICPTGYLNDDSIENFEYFPLFDIQISKMIFERIGLRRVICDEEFHEPLLSLLSSSDFERFCELRMMLLQSAFEAKRSELGRPPHPRAICEHIKEMDFGDPPDDLNPDCSRLINRLERGIQKSALLFKSFATAYEKQSGEAATGVRKRVVIFTVTDVELQAFKEQAAASGFSYNDTDTISGCTYEVWHHSTGIEIAHVRTAMGSISIGASQPVSLQLLPSLAPSLVLSLGICFGMKEKEQKYGDVIVSESVVPYELGKLGENGFESRGNAVACCPNVANYCRHLSNKGFSFAVLVGPTFSGEKVINHETFRDGLLKIHPKGIGGDMEALGISNTCSAKQLRFAMIKGICDFAAQKGDDHQLSAARNSSIVVFDLIFHFHRKGML